MHDVEKDDLEKIELTGAALAQHREGRMRILGVGSNERLEALPANQRFITTMVTRQNFERLINDFANLDKDQKKEAQGLYDYAKEKLAGPMGFEKRAMTRARAFPGGAIPDFALFLAEVRKTWPFLGDARSAFDQPSASASESGCFR